MLVFVSESGNRVRRGLNCSDDDGPINIRTRTKGPLYSSGMPNYILFLEEPNYIRMLMMPCPGIRPNVIAPI